MEKIRRASHAGSWYTDNPKRLAEGLDGWLRDSGLHKSPDVRGVIAPLFLFRPCSCFCIWKYSSELYLYLFKQNPLTSGVGHIPVNEELKATGKFEFMDLEVDEAEHSMEMHLPYLAKVFQGYTVKIVPILVGALNAENEAMFGRLLAKYVDDPNNFFSVSSDFCHWGSWFDYMHYDRKHGAINKSIEALDRMGMDIIETGDADAFKQYLLETDNTICGRHPISVFLHMLRNSSTKIKINFLRYEQSNRCKNMRDSRVSYAAAAAKVDG